MWNLRAAKWEGQAGPLQWMAMARGADSPGRGGSGWGPVPHCLVKASHYVFSFVSRWPQASCRCPMMSKISQTSEHGRSLFVPTLGPPGSDFSAEARQKSNASCGHRAQQSSIESPWRQPLPASDPGYTQHLDLGTVDKTLACWSTPGGYKLLTLPLSPPGLFALGFCPVPSCL